MKSFFTCCIVASLCFTAYSISPLQEYGFSNAQADGWKLIAGNSYAPLTKDQFSDIDELNTALAFKRYDARDQPHETNIYRSPQFRISKDSEISVFLLGGTGGSEAPPGTSAALAANTTDKGYLGIAVRRVDDDRYLMWGRRSKPGIRLNWQEIRWGPEDLKFYASETTLYTIDLIDNFHGSWGWIAMDDVLMPMPVEAVKKITTVVEPKRVCVKAVRDYRREIAAVVALSLVFLAAFAFYLLRRFS